MTRNTKLIFEACGRLSPKMKPCTHDTGTIERIYESLRCSGSSCNLKSLQIIYLLPLLFALSKENPITRMLVSKRISSILVAGTVFHAARFSLSAFEPHYSNEAHKFFSSSTPLHIDCILSDVDGTLLDSDHHLPDRTFKAVSNTMKKGYPFYPCTGRSRKSMVNAIGQRFVDLWGGKVELIPGVYQQGLTVYGPNGDVIYERFLDLDVLTNTLEFCRQHNIEVVAYAGDEIFVRKQGPYSLALLANYSEPLATEYAPGLDKLDLINVKVNKLILIDDEAKLVAIRPALYDYLGNTASLTKAVPGMLEVLPPGASKGYGVSKLLNHIGVAPERVVAFGDGENDLEMLQLVGYGIAVQNAKSILKDVARFITASNDESGVALVLESLPEYKLSTLGNLTK